MNQQLRKLQEFCQIYIDDIISFFKSFNDYLIHFRRLFIVLIRLRVILNFKKIYFNYFNITLLNQRINVFNLLIIKERIIIIKVIKFLKNLKNLKTYLNMINYQRNKVA